MRSFTVFTFAALALAGCDGNREPAENPTAAGRGGTVTNVLSNDVAVGFDPVDYANQVSALDLFQTRSAQLALEHATSPRVQELARRVALHHQFSAKALENAAGRSRPRVILNPQLDVEQQRSIDELRAAIGGNFDRQYLLQQVDTHQQAYALADNYARTGEDDAMRQHAAQMAVPIHEHLIKARQIAEDEVR